MRRELKAFSNSDRDEVSEKDGILQVFVKAPAKDNKANIAIIKTLTKHFKREVRLVSGLTNKKKIIEIYD